MLKNDLKLTEKLLEQLEACESGIKFTKRNKLIGFPLKELPNVKGDYSSFIRWLDVTNIREFDENGNVTKYRVGNDIIKQTFNGRGDVLSVWTNDEQTFKNVYDNDGRLIERHEPPNILVVYEYDNNNNVILKTNTKTGSFEKYTYDKDSNLISNINNNVFGYYKKYDNKGNLIHEKSTLGFECWMSYNSNGNRVKYKCNTGYSYEKKYDENNNLIYFKDSDGVVKEYKYDANSNLIYYSWGGVVCNYITELYDDGQLKRIEGMEIPYFEK